MSTHTMARKLDRIEAKRLYCEEKKEVKEISRLLSVPEGTIYSWKGADAEKGNDWDKLFAGTLPTWLMVTDLPALIPFYRGGSTLFTPAHISAWLKPIAAWTVFIWALLLMMLCVNTILRRAWIDRERLTFPIVALPLAGKMGPAKAMYGRLASPLPMFAPSSTTFPPTILAVPMSLACTLPTESRPSAVNE